MKKIFLILGCSIFLCVASCGGGGDPAPGAPSVDETPDTDDAAMSIFWVSSSEGSDDNPGTIDQPFQTITKALRASQEGATYKDIHVVGGDYNESLLLVTSGIGIYGGYGELTTLGTRERDIESNPTNIQLDKCGITSTELTHGDTITIDGFNITAPNVVFCLYDGSVNITNNNIHATLSDEHGVTAVFYRPYGRENINFIVNIENNVITVDDNWVKDNDSATRGITFHLLGTGVSASLNVKNNEINVGDGRRDSYGLDIFQSGTGDISFIATGNTIQTGTAGKGSTAIVMAASSGTAYSVGGTAIIEGNTLMAGDIDQSVKGEFLTWGAGTSGIVASGFGETGQIRNNVIVTGEHGDHSWGMSFWYGNNYMIYNNTIVARESAEDFTSKAIVLTENSSIQAKNNIICAHGGDGIYEDRNASIVSLTSNLFCDGMNNLVAGFEGAYPNPIAYDSISDLMGTSYADDSNLIGDPGFIDEANLNFHMQTGSAALDAGEDLTGFVDDDIDGQSRPRGTAFDIGAYEHD